MREQFVAVSAKRTRQPYIHATCATDTGQCRVVMAAVSASTGLATLWKLKLTMNIGSWVAVDQTLASNLEKAVRFLYSPLLSLRE